MLFERQDRLKTNALKNLVLTKVNHSVQREAKVKYVARDESFVKRKFERTRFCVRFTKNVCLLLKKMKHVFVDMPSEVICVTITTQRTPTECIILCELMP